MDLLFPSTLHNTNIIFLLIFSCTVWMLFIVPDKKEFNNTKNPMMAYSILLSMPCLSFLVTYSGKLLSGFFFFLSFFFFFFFVPVPSQPRAADRQSPRRIIYAMHGWKVEVPQQCTTVATPLHVGADGFCDAVEIATSPRTTLLAPPVVCSFPHYPAD